MVGRFATPPGRPKTHVGTAAARIRASLPQIWRYGIVGVTSNLIGYLIYLLLTGVGVEPKLAMTMLYAISVAIGFLGNRRWAFFYRGSLFTSLWRYLLAHFFGYAINFGLLFFLADGLGYPHAYVQAAAVFIVAGYLFLALRFFVFPAKADGGQLEPVRPVS